MIRSICNLAEPPANSRNVVWEDQAVDWHGEGKVLRDIAGEDEKDTPGTI